MHQSRRGLTVFLNLSLVALVFAQPAISQESWHEPVQVSGTLLGVDALPMQQAHIAVQGGPQNADILAPADHEGRFSLELPGPGGYALNAMGVHHETFHIPLILTAQESVTLDLQLSPVRISHALDSVWVVQEDVEKVLMKHESDGRYAAHVAVASDTLVYQIEAITLEGDRLVLAGVEADTYVLAASGRFTDGKSDYLGMIAASDGGTTVTYDAAVIAGAAGAPLLRSSPPEIAELGMLHLDLQVQAQRVSEAFDEWRNKRIDRDEYQARLAKEHELAKRNIAAETRPLMRQWRMMRYFDSLMAPAEDSVLARALISEVSPSSPFWSYEARSRSGAAMLIRVVAGRIPDPEPMDQYLRVASGHPDHGVRAQVMMAAVILADGAGNAVAQQHYYQRLQDLYGDSWQANFVRRDYSPVKAIAGGNPMPEFEFTDLDDASVTHSNESLKGTVYLMDFWGTWCVPCVEKLPEMHEVYEALKGDGFEIISVAVMETRAPLQKFRKERFPMPWPNTLVNFMDFDAVTAKFEVTKFPSPILVDRTGIIVAVDYELRGGKLMNAVKGALRQ